MSIISMNVIGILHKDPDTPYGISFPGLPDPVFELSDKTEPDFASEISSLLREYFLHLIQTSKPVQVDPKRQSAAINEAAEDPTWAGHTESEVSIEGTDVKVSTTVYPIEADGT